MTSQRDTVRPGTIFVDVTELIVLELRTGIQRVVREILRCGMTPGPARGTACLPVVPVVAVGRRFHRLSDAGLARLEASGLGAGARRMTHERGLPQLARLVKRAARLSARVYNTLQRLHLRRLLSHARSSYEQQRVAFADRDVLCLIDSFWGGSSTLQAAEQAKAEGARIVLFGHDLIPLSHPQFVDPLLVGKFRAQMRRAVGLSSRVLANSEATAMAFRANFPAARVKAVPLGFDLSETGRAGGGTNPETCSHRGRSRWPDGLWNGPGRVVVIVGSIEPRKGHRTVLEGFEQRWSCGKSDKLLIIGKIGWQVDELMERIDGHEQAGRRLFHVHDATDAMLAEALRRADAGIVASHIEGFGLPLVEGLAAGLPMIASDIAVFHEIAGGAALYFVAGDAQSLSAALDRLEADDAGRRAAAASFSWPSWREAAACFYAQIEREAAA